MPRTLSKAADSILMATELNVKLFDQYWKSAM